MGWLSPKITNDRAASAGARRTRNSSAGLSLPELVVALLIGVVAAAIAIPAVTSAIASMRMHSMITDVGGAISRTRYRAIMNSQTYTLAIAAPADTYVVTDVSSGAVDAAIPLSEQSVAIGGGANAIYTFTFCPNGMVYGAGAACPAVTAPPVLVISYQGRISDINTTSVGNVTTTVVH